MPTQTKENGSPSRSFRVDNTATCSFNITDGGGTNGIDWEWIKRLCLRGLGATTILGFRNMTQAHPLPNIPTVLGSLWSRLHSNTQKMKPQTRIIKKDKTEAFCRSKPSWTFDYIDGLEGHEIIGWSLVCNGETIRNIPAGMLQHKQEESWIESE